MIFRTEPLPEPDADKAITALALVMGRTGREHANAKAYAFTVYREVWVEQSNRAF